MSKCKLAILPIAAGAVLLSGSSFGQCYNGGMPGTVPANTATFGWATDTDSDWVAVSGFLANNSDEGRVYMFRRFSAGFQLMQELGAPDVTANQFGSDVAIDLPWLAVGARADDLWASC